MKLCFRIAKGTSISDDLDAGFEGINRAELLKYLGTLRAGTRMHLIVRPRPGFDVEAMRNYFHGPMLDWIVAEIKDMGIRTSREEMRDELKRTFIGTDKDGKTLSIAGTLEVITDDDVRDPEKKYREFLSDVRLWCIDTLHGEPPLPDEVDLNEEQRSCSTPEKT